MTKEGDDENTWGDHPKLEINGMLMMSLNVHWSTKLEIFLNEGYQSK